MSPSTFKSDQYLKQIGSTLKSNTQLRESTIKKTAATIVFNIKNKEGESKSYLLDLKDTGELSDLQDPKSVDPDITINIGDLDFKKLVLGKSNAQKLFMSGKLKIKGNVMKLANIENILKSANPVKLKL